MQRAVERLDQMESRIHSNGSWPPGRIRKNNAEKPVKIISNIWITPARSSAIIEQLVVLSVSGAHRGHLQASNTSGVRCVAILAEKVEEQQSELAGKVANRKIRARSK